MKIYAKTDIGKVRTTNEDCYDFEIINTDVAWALVCDGMGAAVFGEIASNMAKEIVRKELNQYFCNYESKKITDESIKNEIIKCIKLANEEIFNKSSSDKKFNGMGTTLVLAIICCDVLHIAHVGDSRAYLLNKENVKRLTLDHSLVEELVKSGKITNEEAKCYPQKNVITRALGVSENIEIDYDLLTLEKEDNIFLCTDCLSNYVNSKCLASYFLKYKESDFINELVNYANNLGGKDNITALYISRSWSS